MSCKHLRKVKHDEVAGKYRNLCERLIYPSNEVDYQRKVKFVRCFPCAQEHCQEGPVLCCCLDCIFFGCLSHQHFQKHSETTGHALGVSIASGYLYCALCADLSFDRELESIRRAAENSFRRSLGFSLRFSWNPGRVEIDLLRAARKRTLKVTPKFAYGLRGLMNLGNTCFMNCILQALTHTPLLRDYFMSDQHRCPQQQQASSSGGRPHHHNKCLMCEMAKLFQEFYTGAKTPLMPSRMLHLVWTHARHLAGYEQQDAHEFFIAALDVLHRHSKSSGVAKNPHECQCIIDRIFTGKLQSDVTCQSCNGVSTTFDPYWDISLDLGGSFANTFHPSLSKVATSVDELSSMMSDENHLSTPQSTSTMRPSLSATALSATGRQPERLQDCLNNFIRSEHLGSGAKIRCNRCQAHQESTKQLTMRKLPIVACFHLKRFEQRGGAKFHKKIGSFVQFPEQLDMTPYTSAFRDQTHSAGDALTFTPTRRRLDRLKNKYCLFAVVNHQGTIESGHYTCFIKKTAGASGWFKCDDAIVTRASLDDVLNSQGYLLFYHKQFLDYD